MLQFTQQQSDAIKAVEYWYKNDTKKKQIFRLFGYAGTGKTTIAKYFAGLIGGNVYYCAYTGKASLVMRKAGCSDASTIHSYVYRARKDKHGNPVFEWNDMSVLYSASLIIVDECSMVDEELAMDLMRFKKPILVLGDPAQLKPVKGEGYFTNATPDALLTEIHRQSKDNPIIWLATRVREGHDIQPGAYGNCKVVTKISENDLLTHEQVVVGRNNTRTNINRRIRKLLDYKGDFPNVEERLICLENEKTLGIFNGGMFSANSCMDTLSKPGFINMSLSSLDEENKNVKVQVHKSCFSDDFLPPSDWRKLKGSYKFDYGYAITCHKSQGSQWESSLIYDESWCFREHSSNWLYTAITRNTDWFTLYRSS